MTERHFTFHGHEIVHDTVHDETFIEAPCSVPLTVANAFDFMIENCVKTLVVDGVEIRRTR